MRRSTSFSTSSNSMCAMRAKATASSSLELAIDGRDFAGSCDDARAMVRDLSRPIGRFIYYLVCAANPKLTDDEVRQAVLQIFSLEEGYKLFIGMGPDDSSAIRSAEKDIRDLTLRIIQAA